jgi:prepilin-type N-terminal cleavage/methylation domain-containing protein
MMKKRTTKNSNVRGFSLLELLIAMVMLLLLMGIVSSLLARSLSVRARERSRTDALTSAQAALNVLSREIANGGFGLAVASDPRIASNGIITADSNASQIHIRSNFNNIGPRVYTVTDTVMATRDPGEDITFFYDATTKSILRYDPNDTPTTSSIVNRVSNVSFKYFDYVATNSTGTEVTTPTNNTGRIQITINVNLDPVYGQPNPSNVTFTSDVTLRNSKYMLQQY